MSDLDANYTVEVDRIDKPQWHDLLTGFDDATFYQTWSYGEKFWGAHNLSHVILKHKGRVVSMAQLRVLRYPVLRTGAAYLNWGPLWRMKGRAESKVHLRNMLRALSNEYVGRRNFALRILPKILDKPENKAIRTIFSEEGYACSPDSLRTFIVDLHPPLEEIRQNLHRSWKRSLKFAEQQGLEIFEAEDPRHFAIVEALNKEMKHRKHYYGGDCRDLLEANFDLPSELRLKVLLCYRQGDTIAALGWSNIGKLCLPLISGTGNKALPYKASFLLFWKMVQHAKENGFAYCDTAGIHEKRNPGSYFFKKGLAGKDARETAYLGQFDAYKSYASFLLFRIAMLIREKFVNAARYVKPWLR